MFFYHSAWMRLLGLHMSLTRTPLGHSFRRICGSGELELGLISPPEKEDNEDMEWSIVCDTQIMIRNRYLRGVYYHLLICVSWILLLATIVLATIDAGDFRSIHLCKCLLEWNRLSLHRPMHPVFGITIVSGDREQELSLCVFVCFCCWHW